MHTDSEISLVGIYPRDFCSADNLLIMNGSDGYISRRNEFLKDKIQLHLHSTSVLSLLLARVNPFTSTLDLILFSAMRSFSFNTRYSLCPNLTHCSISVHCCSKVLLARSSLDPPHSLVTLKSTGESQGQAASGERIH